MDRRRRQTQKLRRDRAMKKQGINPRALSAGEKRDYQRDERNWTRNNAQEKKNKMRAEKDATLVNRHYKMRT